MGFLKSEEQQHLEKQKQLEREKKLMQQFYLEQQEWKRKKEQEEKQLDHQQAALWKNDTELYRQQLQNKEQAMRAYRIKNAQSIKQQIQQKSDMLKTKSAMNVQDLLINQNKFKQMQEQGQSENYGLVVKPIPTRQ